MTSTELRRSFLEFFRQRDHQVVPSSPLVLPSDPSLLFANAGMNQFKEVFRGREERPYVRAASVQRCLRVSGKHNDLEEVGRTPRHHTFFEMLGNFSFGDYFKERAIEWAWELLTGSLGLDPERLHVTVFRGDEDFPADEEAARLWTSIAGVPPGRVTAMPRKDNFWQMGETGPAGPCSEIHWDIAPGGPEVGTPETDPERFLEVWNLVFMQYDLQPDGTAPSLPAPCVDTGAGLERMAAVLQGVSSNYDTDLFQSIIRPLAEEAGATYGENADRDISLRVIADHLRAITMLVAEGIIPGPAKRGSVLRRILRRALRHGRLLGLPSPFLHRHVDSVVAVMGDAYPELVETHEIVSRVVEKEETRFDRTLADGFERFEERIAALLDAGETTLPGEEAFVLESERGLPLDLVRDALEERGLGLDAVGYESARRKHVETSRVLKEDAGAVTAAEVYVPMLDAGSRFVGRETLRVEAARIVGLFADGAPVTRLESGRRGEAVLDQSPFYAESGGQVGDQGRLLGGEARVRVVGTRSPLAGVIVHAVEIEGGALEMGQVVVAEVDDAHRAGAERHHTGTHLLHAALRQVLGTHVRQAGSLVAPDRLRFDFSHYEGVDPSALADIEDLANDAILADTPVETEIMPLDDALASGAMAFFGDRYGDRVRVVRIGEFSLELCGGTHVERTGEIGPLLVTGERGVAAGVRRMEALAGPLALVEARRDRELAGELARVMGVPRGDLVDGVRRKLETIRELKRELDEAKLALARGAASSDETVTDLDGVSVIARRVSGLARNQRRDLADGLRQKHGASVVVLAAEEDGKAALLVAVGREAAGRVDARAVIRRIAPLVGGGGGGRPDLAEAGGKNPEGIGKALAAAPDAVREALSAAG